MKLERYGTRRRARVEMIPLIDCMFIVLVFFIASMLAMTIRRGIVVQLPAAEQAELSREDAITITITRQGAVMVDDQVTDLEGLRGALRRLRGGEAGRERPVLVSADAASEHRWFVAVLDELKASGVTRVTVLARSGEQP